jgi:large subunit ribosomal protein L24
MNKQKTPEQKLRVALKHEGWAHGDVRTLDVRSGDTVEIIAGKYKGKRGKVERTLLDKQRIVVAGVHVAKRHTRAGVKGAVQGGIVDFNAPFSYSNVQLVCNRCDKRTRIRHKVDDVGEKYLECIKCGERQERSVEAS